ncbi:hypothetical protein BE17_52840 [Sorangium cellulosum]|uniref:Secreted protein n=1 Tax=Sorangium cellulosum TaxID=56 RepID=A0A150S6Z9_SORCE|nr:hypothetical protein BE17_52840 [Sorangium cellulosum]
MSTTIQVKRGIPRWAAVKLALLSLVIAGTGNLSGCGQVTYDWPDRPAPEPPPPPVDPPVAGPPETAIDKIDLLLAIDNSGSMADKQALLALAVPDLVASLVNPRCIHSTGEAPPVAVRSPNDACPADFRREFEPIKDIHVGIISSSLGGHGASSCPASASASNMDMAHLLARTDERSGANDIPTYLDKGFLAWDPDQKLAGEPGVPDAEDGEADLDTDSDADANDTSLIGQLTHMVKGTGQAGCGFEAQLESVYRFLVDPEPYASIELQDDIAVPTGLDEDILRQRREFLRPSSLLAILLLSDENDCSIREEGRNYLVAETRSSFRLWRPRSECAIDPGDRCCRSCSQNQDGCPVDPTCIGPDGELAKLSPEDDPVNARCWDQKRRFGFDFLYPIARYRRAFTEAQIENRQGELVPNPIFSDLNPGDRDTDIRDPGRVFFAGIVGVPWQDIARQNADGQPDLLRGLDERGEPVGGFKSASELAAPLLDGALDGAISSTWELILGDPARSQPPRDPFMIESMAPRAGSNPITGDAIVPPHEAGWNNLNGREYTVPRGSTREGDLQFACIFPLFEPKDCGGTTEGCDCREAADVTNDSPLCQPAAGNDLADPQPRTATQVNAKAYPGLRELELIRELGPQGIVASVCPRQLADDDAADFGYRPAIGAIVDRLKPALGAEPAP